VIPRRGLLALALLLLGGATGCLREPPPPSDPELAEALGLPADTPIHAVELVDRSGQVGVFPSTLALTSGSVVQFRTRDRRTYGVRFLVAEMSSAQRDFLSERGQVSSPPLVEEGARFVVTFQEAPAGRYPFVVEGQGSPGHGEIVVTGPE
jgi:hypothetical protein